MNGLSIGSALTVGFIRASFRAKVITDAMSKLNFLSDLGFDMSPLFNEVEKTGEKWG